MKIHSHALLVFLSAASTVWAFTSTLPTFVVRKQNNNAIAISYSTSFHDGRCHPLFGILDEVNSDAFNLLGSSSTDKSPGSARGGGRSMDDAYEIFLAELVFSPNDPRLDIVERYHQATDEDFLTWLKNKFENTRDAEEKVALKDLYGMILDVQNKVELSQLAEERKKAEEKEAEQLRIQTAESEGAQGRTLSNAEVLKKAAQVDTAGVDSVLNKAAGDREQGAKKLNFLEQELSPEIRMSYEGLVKELLPPYKPGLTVQSVVFNLYDRCDAQLIKVLKDRTTNGDEDSQAVLDAIAVEQQKRLAAATERLKIVLAAGDPMRMEGAIVKLSKEGGIDEPFLLLLEANASQAEAAGATGPAQLMRRLRMRAMEEKDKLAKSKEIALLRKLLRAEDSTQREKILEDAFTPREQLLVAGTAANAAKAMEGEVPEQEKPQPDVPPPVFINACKAVLINFGNLGTDEKGDLTSMVRQIAAEAEVVATRIYGKGMSPREQQERMWKEKTTSIFDLETMEIEAERMGEQAPWSDPDNDDILPGFDTDGRMRIGGG